MTGKIQQSGGPSELDPSGPRPSTHRDRAETGSLKHSGAVSGRSARRPHRSAPGDRSEFGESNENRTGSLHGGGGSVGKYASPMKCLGYGGELVFWPHGVFLKGNVEQRDIVFISSWMIYVFAQMSRCQLPSWVTFCVCFLLLAYLVFFFHEPRVSWCRPAQQP